MSWLKNLSRVVFEGVASVASGTSFMVSMMQDPLKLASNDESELPINIIYMTLVMITLLTSLDAFVHCTIYDEYSDTDTDDNSVINNQNDHPTETQPLLTNLQHRTNLGYQFLVFCCTLSCSLDSAGAPAAICYILEAIKVISGTSRTTHIVRLSTTLGASAVALWNCNSQWNMGMKHLQEYFAKREEQNTTRTNTV